VGACSVVPPVDLGRGAGSAGVSRGATGATMSASVGRSRVAVPVEGSRVTSVG
jgi:hypothetical protein